MGCAIRNKVLVNFYLESGCKQEEDEVSIDWAPLNFQIYSDLFPGLIQEAAEQWLSEHKLATERRHEVIFAHVVEREGAGALVDEYFEPITHEFEIA